MEILGNLFWLFICYSFLGWILETVTAAVKQKSFVNRGFLNGPLCVIYGIAGVAITLFFWELRGNWFFLFLGSMVMATLVEWVAGILLEHLGVGKWWDYSKKRFNLGGYICLQNSLLWGLLGTVAVTWGDDLLLALLNWMPELVRGILLIAILVLVVVDLAGSLAAIRKIRHMPQITEANARIEEATQWLGHSITDVVARRLQKAHPQAVGRREKTKPTVFAQGCGYYKLFWLLIVGAFLGDIVETIFVRLTSGTWMSRSSLVWGQFSLVWGIAMAAATALLYRYRDKSDSFLFVFGTVLGGAYEYACSVFTEKLFGTVFWDYSKIPFNLGGRINLLYCFFWGIAAVIWLKRVYPILSGWIEKIPMKAGKVATWILTVFLVVDVVFTCGAMVRYQQRSQGVPAGNPVSSYLDAAFPDEWMEQRYQNMKLTG